MRVEVVMPQMGESIVEGTVVAWIKQVGDLVERDEDIFTLTTDKVDAEVPSPATGRLVEILAQPGDTVEVGAVVAWVETDVSVAAGAAAPAAAAATPPLAAPATAAAVPPPPQVPASALPAVPPPPAIPVGAGIDEPPAADADVESVRRRRSTPLVRKIAAEHGITDLSPIEGTGVSGRVTRDDILRYIESGAPAAAQAAPAPAAPTPAAPASAPAKASAGAKAATTVPLGEFGVPAGYEIALAKTPRVHVYANDVVEPMTRMRASIAENMLQARRTTAHCQTVWECDVTGVLKAREKMRADFEARGAKLTVTAFFVEAVAEALRRFPVVNSAIDGTNVVKRGNVNIGLASAIDGGLIVPVLKQVDGLNLFGIARGVNDLATRSKANQLAPADVADGTFTITNSGVFGSLFGVPILIPPQVGILNIGGIKKRVVVDDDDNLRIRSMCYLCLTFDHRLIDGATADAFVGHIVQKLASYR